MRSFLLVALFSSATQLNAMDRSGLFVCSPELAQQKPILYAFDGKHLIRDEVTETPFTKIASLTENIDLYFAFEPNIQGRQKLKAKNALEKQPEIFQSELEDFKTDCRDFSTYSDHRNYDLTSIERHKEIGLMGTFMFPPDMTCELLPIGWTVSGVN